MFRPRPWAQTVKNQPHIDLTLTTAMPRSSGIAHPPRLVRGGVQDRSGVLTCLTSLSLAMLYVHLAWSPGMTKESGARIEEEKGMD
jgi:hypothetical protein